MPDDSPQRPAPSEKEEKRLREEYGLDKTPSNGSRLAFSGLEFGGIVVACILLGLWLDSKFGTKPWILLVLMVFGMAGGMVRLIRRVMKNAEN